MNRRIAALTLAALLAVVGRAPAQNSPRSAVAVPGLPLFGLPAQDLGLGNASVGFVLGLHF